MQKRRISGSSWMELARLAANAAAEIDGAARGVGYRDGKIQAFADLFDEYLDDEDQFRWMPFMEDLAADVGVALPGDREISPYMKALSGALREALIPGLRNVGSRGKAGAERMSAACNRIARRAMAASERAREGRKVY